MLGVTLGQFGATVDFLALFHLYDTCIPEGDLLLSYIAESMIL